MATVYDAARSLARALRESDEHRQMRRLAAQVSADSRLESLLSDFRSQQFAVQAARLQGHPPSREQSARLERLSKTVEGEPGLREYLQAEAAYGRMLVEVQQLLTESFSPDVAGTDRSSSR